MKRDEFGGRFRTKGIYHTWQSGILRRGSVVIKCKTSRGGLYGELYVQKASNLAMENDWQSNWVYGVVAMATNHVTESQTTSDFNAKAKR